MPAGKPELEANTGTVAIINKLMETRREQATNERLKYTIESYTGYTLEAASSRDMMADSLKLPEGYNPRTLAFAATLRQQ